MNFGHFELELAKYFKEMNAKAEKDAKAKSIFTKADDEARLKQEFVRNEDSSKSQNELETSKNR